MAPVLIENVYKTFPATRLNRSEKAGDPAGLQESLTVLRRIHLDVADGEFMVLVGPSGCGKSTLLRLIAGLEEISAGTIWVGGQRVNDLPPKLRDIAMVFQSYALYPHLSVYDNLAFGLRRMRQGAGQQSQQNMKKAGMGQDANLELAQILATSRWWEDAIGTLTRRLPPALRYLPEAERLIDERVRAVAKMLQIGPLLHRFPRQLSGGQKQRVALGRAMARNPQVFLMDEPLSNLDAKLRTETRSQIVSLQRKLGITTIYVTHDQVEAMTMGDRIAIMNQGQIQQVAAPLELYQRPANRFVAEFIGSPTMNFLTVQVQSPSLLIHPKFRLSISSEWDEVLKPYDGRTVTLGIRPEHLSLGPPAPKNLEGEVSRVEALGSETYLSVQFEGETLQARIGPDHAVRLGDSVWLAIAADKVHLFDPDSGRSLRAPVPA
ncbi:MAG: ABC transporter ATP-binding protein [Cyanobacteria bacterium Co-bin13]|nr:ABC transporter ATP-binding protein [Cyanobacteria bacterium Co-bin13]